MHLRHSDFANDSQNINAEQFRSSVDKFEWLSYKIEQSTDAVGTLG